MTIFGAVAPFFGAFILLWVLSRLIVSEADADRHAREFDGDKIEFVTNRRSFWGVYGFIACFSFVILSSCIRGIAGSFDLVPTVLCMGFILLLLAAFPGTLTISPDGLEQYYWLTRGRKIGWKEVKAVVIDKKKKRVTISGPGSKKIVHTRQLPDRDRFIAEIAKRRPELLPEEYKQSVAVAS